MAWEVIKVSDKWRSILDIKDEKEQTIKATRYVNELENKIYSLEKQIESMDKNQAKHEADSSSGWDLPQKWAFMTDEERRGWAGDFG